MSKKVTAMVKLQIPAGKATPAPPVGTALGPHGLNIMDFCKNFNAKTAKDEGLIIPVVVTIYDDRSFDLQLKTPPTSALLASAAGLAKGSGRPGADGPVAKLGRDRVREIARTKLPDLNTDDLDAAERIVAGTARSMGIELVDLDRS